jgi:predicted GTPase
MKRKMTFRDLEDTVNSVDCDCIVIGTASDLSHTLKLNKPSVLVMYSKQVVPEHSEQFNRAVDSVFERFARASH